MALTVFLRPVERNLKCAAIVSPGVSPDWGTPYVFADPAVLDTLGNPHAFMSRTVKLVKLDSNGQAVTADSDYLLEVSDGGPKTAPGSTDVHAILPPGEAAELLEKFVSSKIYVRAPAGAKVAIMAVSVPEPL